MTEFAVAPWTVMVTKNSSEEIAENSLRKIGYRVYLPRYRKRTAPHGRASAVLRPLFVRVVFVQDWRGFPDRRPIIGVEHTMQTHRGGGPARLVDQDISLIMQREREGVFDEIRFPYGDRGFVPDDIEVGDVVSLQRAGVEILAMLVELTPRGKALLENLITGTRITVGAHELEKVAIDSQ